MPSVSHDPERPTQVIAESTPVPAIGGPAATPTEADGPASSFRPDIEGLRGVAILLVVLFHAGLPVPGGFIGVDVFFVISGFLITGLLVREYERSGRVSLGNFYARRIRRMLPAGALVLTVTMAASIALVGVLDRPAAMADAAASALSVANIRSALAEGDYFAAIAQPKPFLHFWSLSVEEQFYLVWPALLFLAAGGRRRRVGVVMGLVLAGSFAANLVVTDSSSAWAFYSLPTRAWQFALGGLVALAGASLARAPRLLSVPLGWAALGALAAAAMLIGERTPYPGVVAVAPTLAAAVLIATGAVGWGPGALLVRAPLRFLGRISYSLYLWHWPALTLAPLAIGVALDPVSGSVVVLAAVLVAWASWRFVEEPFRHGRLSIAFGVRRAVTVGLTSILAVALIAGGLEVRSQRAIDEIALTAGTPSPVASGSPVPAPTPDATASASTAPAPTATPPPTATPVPLLTWRDIPDSVPPDPIALTSDVRPLLNEARSDAESLYRDRCASQVDDLRPVDCVYGDPAGTFTVVLIGDSHAGHWFPALQALATERAWRLVPYVKLSCPLLGMRVEHLATSIEYTECESWREEVLAIVTQRPPDLTIVAMSHRGIFPVLASDKDIHRQAQAIARDLIRIPGRVLMMIDTPRIGVDIPGCIADHATDVRPCAIPRSAAFTSQFGVREAEAATLAGAGVIDLIPSVCPAMPCQVVRDGMILFRDNHHLTATFSRSLAPILGRALEPYLPPTPERIPPP